MQTKKLELAAMDFDQKITPGKLGIHKRPVSTVRPSLLPELFQQNKVHWKLWMSTCPRGRSVQNLTLVFGVKSSSLNTNY